MAQTINLETCSLDRLRILTPIWSISTIKEALGIYRQVFKKYGAAVPLDILRREQIVRNELQRRMKPHVSKSDIHETIENLIGHDPKESPFKLTKR